MIKSSFVKWHLLNAAKGVRHTILSVLKLDLTRELKFIGKATFDGCEWFR
jgi:hypothetical protein